MFFFLFRILLPPRSTLTNTLFPYSARFLSVLAQFLAHPRAFGLEHAAIEIADDPLERLVRRIGAAPILERQFDRHSAAAIKDDLLHPPRQILPRRRQVEVIGFAQAFQHLHIIRRGRVGFRPRHDRTLLDRSEEHTSELQSLMRTSYAVFCLKKKKLPK